MIKGLLNSRKEMAKLDKSNILASIENLANQINDTWQTANKIKFDFDPAKIKNIVWLGMGGSALGAWVGKYLFKTSLKLPFEIINNYQLPAYVNEDSLVILSSYSGNTEEVLAGTEMALAKKANIVAITAGGKLKAISQKRNLSAYIIDPVYNPSNQPRMAIGYAVTGLLAIFNKLNFIQISDNQISQVIKGLKQRNNQFKPETKDDNLAKFLAYTAFKRIIFFISANHLIGSVHVFNNQVNENAKNLTVELVIPEMNHHFLEALSFPPQLRDDIAFFLFDSDLFQPRIRQRIKLSQKLIDRIGYPNQIIKAESLDKLSQVFEIIQLGAYTSFYLAMLNGINPAPIPHVDFLKENLAKMKSPK